MWPHPGPESSHKVRMHSRALGIFGVHSVECYVARIQGMNAMWPEVKGRMLCGSNSRDECYVARIQGMKETEGDGKCCLKVRLPRDSLLFGGGYL